MNASRSLWPNRRIWCAVIFFWLIILNLVSCSTKRNFISSNKSDLFSLTNTMMDDEKVQVVKSTFGLGILPRRSDLTIRFGTNGRLHVTFDQATLTPQTILLVKPMSDPELDEKIYDYNADGIPDLRKINDEVLTQVFYKGNWYYKQDIGTNAVITYEGKPLTLFFDGATWSINTNPPPSPKNPAVRETGLSDRRRLGGTEGGNADVR
jgi:hypothetical protein